MLPGPQVALLGRQENRLLRVGVGFLVPLLLRKQHAQFQMRFQQFIIKPRGLLIVRYCPRDNSKNFGRVGLLAVLRQQLRVLVVAVPERELYRRRLGRHPGGLF